MLGLLALLLPPSHDEELLTVLRLDAALVDDHVRFLLIKRDCFYTVLRIRDVCLGSRIMSFTHPGSRISDPGSRIRDPKTATKERDEKNYLVVILFL
jgi:hypothetical protein